MYNILIVQSYDLILNSRGLCVVPIRECIIESTGRKRRSVEEETTAAAVCDVFIEEANKAAAQLVNASNNPMSNNAREACISDLILTNDPSVSAGR